MPFERASLSYKSYIAAHPPSPKKGKMCIYIKKLGRGGRREKVLSKRVVSEAFIGWLLGDVPLIERKGLVLTKN